MFKGKKTRLFWCGLFVLILGIYGLLDTILGIIDVYFNYYLTEINGINSSPASNRHSFELSVFNFMVSVVVHNVVWSVVWSITVVVGVYIMKSGVKKEVVNPLPPA